MSTLRRYVFRHWDPVGTIKKKLVDWEIQHKVVKESDAEEQLSIYLKEQLPHLEIRQQVRYDRLIADLLIEKKVAIELKLNLKSTNELNRLLGQIDHYHDWGVCLIVVVVGDCPEDFVDKITRKLKRLWDEEEQFFIKKYLK